MQIPILNGIYTDDAPSLRSAYPTNLTPVFFPSGVSNGYLRPADGIVEFATGSAVCRGSILWEDLVYMVLGSNLVSVASDGTITTIGDVGNDNKPVSMDYSFDRLCIVSNQDAFLWDKSTLVQITDPDLGDVFDVRWVDNYFMFTDGEFLIVSELSDPTSIDPLKYGSAEIDPDPLKSVKKIRNEAHAVGRYSIETFRNIGGSAFPFQRIEGAHIDKGTYGTHSVCEFQGALAFVGSGRREEPAVYIASNGQANRISTREIDSILAAYPYDELQDIYVETRNDRNSILLYIHLKDRTLVYDYSASQAVEQPVWSVLTSAVQGFSKYRARYLVHAYGKWLVGDPTGNRIGYLTDDIGTHFGSHVRWEFGTQIVYNESKGALFTEMELVALTGSIEFGQNPKISTSYSLDGQTWSQDRSIQVGATGDRLKRLVWRRQGRMGSMRMQRFRGDSASHISFLRLEAVLEQLYA